MDDSEVSLNVCLGKQFSGGELFFRGVRCDAHVNSEKNEKVLVIPQPFKESVSFSDDYRGFRTDQLIVST